MRLLTSCVTVADAGEDRIVVVPDYRVLPDFGQIDAAVWSLEQAAPLARSTRGITAVVPRNIGNPFLLTYLMRPGSDEMVHFVNYWLDLWKADGMHERERNYWIRGQPSATPPPRWSVARNVLQWVK
jgi:hypothetical protein